jgi:SAM-dependent methyltransferase
MGGMKNTYDGDEIALLYHRRQWDEASRSTVAFERFVATELAASKRVLDLGCGSGAATAYLAKRHPGTAFQGIDFTPTLVSMAEKEAGGRGLSNLSFLAADWHALPGFGDVDGVISLQALCCVDDWQRASEVIFQQIRPRWIGLLSLFYSGDISCDVSIEEHTRDRSYTFHVIALPLMRRVAQFHGYDLRQACRFDIDLDLRRGDPDVMGTFTVVTAPGSDAEPRRLQISGPMLMEWYNVLLVRAT